MWFILAIAVLASDHCGQAGFPVRLPTFPVRLPTVTFSSSDQCASPLAEDPIIESIKRNISEVIRLAFLSDTCGCNNQDSSWTRVANLNMNDTSQTCPSAWATINTTVRACGRQSSGSGSCNSVFYSTNGRSYKQVCGHIIGYQYSSPNAFQSSVTTLDSWYVDGVSLTHGPPGSRTHVWTFANAYYETTPYHPYTCACMLSNYSDWSYTVPSFVGNNYFCATGSRDNPGPTLLSDNPLWDGVGCTGSNTCCQFNQPPSFCRTLPTTTSDDLEVRICADQGTGNENIYISKIELYVS